MSSTAVRESTISMQQSLALIKNMIRISISSICYHRELFDRNCFMTQEQDPKMGFIHILQSPHSDGVDEEGNSVLEFQDSRAFELTQWLERGVFAAIEAGYLNEMKFAIFTEHPTTKQDLLLETYQFKVSYPTPTNPGGPTLVNDTPVTKKSLKNQASKFVRSLIEFSATLEDLPDNRWITIQLDYVDDTPRDYEPEYFKKATHAIEGLDGSAKYMKIKIGKLASGHHNMSLNYVGLESMSTKSLEAMTPGRPQTPLLPSTPGSAFKAVSSKQTPDSSRVLAPKFGLNPVAISESMSQLLIAGQCCTSTPDLDSGDDTNATAIQEFLSARGEATAKEVSANLSIKEELVKQLCEAMQEQGLLKLRGRYKYYLADPVDLQDAKSRSGTAPITRSSKKIPPAPKKPSRGERQHMETVEAIEDLDSDSQPSAPFAPAKLQHKLVLQKASGSGAASLNSVNKAETPADGSKRVAKRTHDDIIPLSQSSDADDTDQKKKKKRSIIKEPIRLTRLGTSSQDVSAQQGSFSQQ